MGLNSLQLALPDLEDVMPGLHERHRSRRLGTLALANSVAATASPAGSTRRATCRSRWRGRVVGKEEPFRSPLPGILLVEDNDEVALFMHEVLEDAGCNVLCVANVEQAQRALRAGRFDLIILDWNLDGVCGSAILSRLPTRDGLAWPPTIVTSGAAAKDQTVSAIIEMGATSILRKPFRMAQLIQHVRQATKHFREV